MKKFFIAMLVLLMVFAPAAVFADSEESEEASEIISAEPASDEEISENEEITEEVSENLSEDLPEESCEIVENVDDETFEVEEISEENFEEENAEENLEEENVEEDLETENAEEENAEEDFERILEKAVSLVIKSKKAFVDISDLNIPADLEDDLAMMLSEVSDDVIIFSEGGILIGVSLEEDAASFEEDIATTSEYSVKAPEIEEISSEISADLSEETSEVHVCMVAVPLTDTATGGTHAERNAIPAKVSVNWILALLGLLLKK